MRVERLGLGLRGSVQSFQTARALAQSSHLFESRGLCRRIREHIQRYPYELSSAIPPKMIRIATGHSAIVDVNRGRHEYAIRVGGLAVFNPALIQLAASRTTNMCSKLERDAVVGIR